jgi:hypothetical protein
MDQENAAKAEQSGRRGAETGATSLAHATRQDAEGGAPGRKVLEPPRSEKVTPRSICSYSWPPTENHREESPQL